MDAYIGLDLRDKFLEGLHVLGDQRVGLVVGETAVHFIEKERSVLSLIDFLA